jgi:transcriptional regulator with XRE-family HTH domain
MKGVNLVAETGFGEWLRSKRGDRTQREVAASAQIGERTVQRYERDKGPSYELLRLLDALGIRLRPAPRLEAPRALNVEIQSLRHRQEALEARVGGLATGDELREGLDTLRAAIDRLASQGTGEDRPAAGGHNG